MKVTQQRLHQVLDYSPDTGHFTWRVNQGRARQGKRAGTLQFFGYRYIKVDGELMSEHLWAWLYVHGRMPTHQIDHINGSRDDNRLCNLRDVPPHVNKENTRKAQANNSTGFLGVIPEKRRNKFCARICIKGISKHLGTYETPELAHEAYLKAKRALHSGNTI